MCLSLKGDRCLEALANASVEEGNLHFFLLDYNDG